MVGNSFGRICQIGFALALLSLLGTPRNAFAQNAQVAGYVRDAQSLGIAGAEVTLRNVGTDEKRVTRTNDSGLYVLASVPPGTYDLAASAAAFETSTVSALVVETGQSLQVNLRLPLAGVADSVSVKADLLPLIGSRDGSVGAAVDHATIERMPLSGGTFQALLELTPGVVNIPTDSGSYAINGQRPDTTQLLVDGVSANVGVGANFNLQGSAAGQALATTITGGYNGLVSLGALKEFRVMTSTFSPEYGRTPGGQMSIVTESGSNVRTGSLFYRLRDDGLDAKDWFTNRSGTPTTPLSQKLGGGTFGGAILPRRLFHFVSYERLRLTQPRVVNAVVPSLEARRRAVPITSAFLNNQPQPTGPNLTENSAPLTASASDRTKSDTFSARLDAATRPFAQLFGRYNEAPSAASRDGIVYALDTSRRLRTLTVGSSFAASSRLLFDVRANYSHNEAKATYQDSTIPTGWFPAGALAANNQQVYQILSTDLLFASGVLSNGLQEQLQVVTSATLEAGRHSIKAGLDYRRLAPSVRQYDDQVQVSFTSMEDAINGLASSVVVGHTRPATASFTSVGVYAQDTWRPTAPLTLTYGVRWEYAPAPGFGSGEEPPVAVNWGNYAALDLAPGTRLWEPRYTNFAPRLGGSYSVGTSGRLVIRGGVGLFYDLGQQGSSAVINSTLFPNAASSSQTNRPLPLSAAEVAGVPLGAPLTVPYRFNAYVFDPNLRAPYTWQWNAAAEYALTSYDAIDVAYIGARGRRLLQTAVTRAPNSRFTGTVWSIGNDGQSEYDALQARYRRRLHQGLMFSASYTLSQSLDNNSNTTTLRAPTGAGVTDDWGPSDFDVLHAASGAFSWSPVVKGPRAARLALSDWTLGFLGRARSGTPLTVFVGRDSFGFGNTRIERPDVVPNQPFWIDDPTVPGGRRLNRAAFGTPPTRQQGTLARNSIRNFSAYQFDLSVMRTISLPHGHRFDIRVDAFNVFNTPMFTITDLSLPLSSANFGQSIGMLNRNRAGTTGDNLNALYQWGGPRSVEVSVAYSF